MPSQLPIPTVETLRQAFHDAVVGKKESRADRHAGSVYDHFAGISAILWVWEAQRDKDQFEAIFFDKADGQQLTDYVFFHDGEDRILDTYGTGLVSLYRSTPVATAGTFWKGTRIYYLNNDTSFVYEVSEDTNVAVGTVSIDIPINATFSGPTSEINVTTGILKIADPLWDNDWSISRLECSAGTDFEKAEDYRTRVRLLRKDKRVGYAKSIIDKCKSVGAVNVALYQSDFGGTELDFGINVVYVSDSSFTTTEELRLKCLVALESVRVLGADLFVLPMTTTDLTFEFVLRTWDDPRSLNKYEAERTAVSAILDYFDSSSTFSYDLTKIAGEIRRLMPEIVQAVEFTLPAASTTILDDDGNFPTILTKYKVDIDNIYVTTLGPT